MAGNMDLLFKLMAMEQQKKEFDFRQEQAALELPTKQLQRQLFEQQLQKEMADRQRTEALRRFRAENDYFGYGVTATNQDRAGKLGDINAWLSEQNAPPEAVDYYRTLIEDNTRMPVAGDDNAIFRSGGNKIYAFSPKIEDWKAGKGVIGQAQVEMTPGQAAQYNPELQGEIEEFKTRSSKNVQSVVDDFTKMSDRYNKSVSVLTTLEQMEDTLAKANVGPGTGLKKRVQEIGSFFGIEIGEDLSDKQALNALMSQLTLQARSPDGLFGGLPGNTSDRDIQFLKETVGSLGETKEALQAIIGHMKLNALRNINLYEYMAERDIPDNDYRGWERKKIQYLKQNPLYHGRRSHDTYSPTNPPPMPTPPPLPPTPPPGKLGTKAAGPRVVKTGRLKDGQLVYKLDDGTNMLVKDYEAKYGTKR